MTSTDEGWGTPSDWSPNGSTGQRARGTAFVEEAALLRARPGQWRIVTTYPLAQRPTAYTIAMRVRQGLYPAFRPVGAWQCVARTENEEALIWVRFVGEHGEYKEVAGDAP
jgi:hypothetical protein